MSVEQKPCVATVTSLDKGGMEVAVHVPTYSGGIKLTLSVQRDAEGNWRAFIPWVDEEIDQPLHVQGAEVFGGILYLGSPDEETPEADAKPAPVDTGPCSCRSGYASDPNTHNNRVRNYGRCHCACHSQR